MRLALITGTELNLDPQSLHHVIGHVDVQALGLQVNAHKAIGWVIGWDGNFDGLGFQDIVQCVLRVDCCASEG
jgi:hypothetical protein